MAVIIRKIKNGWLVTRSNHTEGEDQMTKSGEWWTIGRGMYENGKPLDLNVRRERAAALRAYNGGGRDKTFPIEQEAEAKAYAQAASDKLGFPVEAMRTMPGLI